MSVMNTPIVLFQIISWSEMERLKLMTQIYHNDNQPNAHTEKKHAQRRGHF